jgi:integrase
VEYRYDYKSAWTTLRKKVGLQDARWHDLRHSFATRLLDLGYSMKDIAIMLRHSSTRPTERYADLRVLKVRIGSLDGAPATSADEEDAA